MLSRRRPGTGQTRRTESTWRGGGAAEGLPRKTEVEDGNRVTGEEGLHEVEVGGPV